MTLLLDEKIGLDGFLALMDDIKANGEGYPLTHKEVRSIARSLLSTIKWLGLSDELYSKVVLLTECIAASGLPHYDRAACAELIVKMIRAWRFERSLHQKESDKGSDSDLWF